jgi:hypothetical protein
VGWLISFVQGMRASWHFGGATRAKSPQAMAGYATALDLLSLAGVDLESAICRSLLPLALSGYCQAALDLGRRTEMSETLARWRPVCSDWKESALTPAEREALEWLETL